MVSGVVAALLGLGYVWISFAVVKQRRLQKISIGDGGSDSMRQVIAAHNNFQNYTPVFLILLLILELSYGAPWLLVAVIGFLFCLGRTMHYIAFTGKMDFKKRKLGMILTFFPIVFSSVCCLIFTIKAVIGG